MTVQYRVRTPFRVAAAIPAVILTLIGAVFIGIGLLNVFKGEPFALLAIVLGAVALGLGLLFGRVLWAGRVPASIEEYGLDDDAGVTEHRNEARARGLLDE